MQSRGLASCAKRPEASFSSLQRKSENFEFFEIHDANCLLMSKFDVAYFLRLLAKDFSRRGSRRHNVSGHQQDFF